MSSSLTLICIQTHLTQYHYQSYSILKKHLLKRIYQTLPSSSVHQRALQPTLVVFPECIGSWFYLMHVPMPHFLKNFFFNFIPGKSLIRQHLFSKHTLFIIYTLIINLYSFCKQLWHNYSQNRTWSGLFTRSFFRLFSRKTCETYLKLFSELAKETNCTIVAGSLYTERLELILNQNKHYNIHYTSEGLYNMSCVFEPINGNVCLIQGKQYPVADEIKFIDRYLPSSSIYSIPYTNINIGIIICADSWFPQFYEKFIDFNNNQKKFLFIIVALNMIDKNKNEWIYPWSGYSYFSTPNDVNIKHIQNLTLEQAWYTYAIKRAYNHLDKYFKNDFGVCCCHGIMSIMNDLQANGASTILLKKNVQMIQEAKTYKNYTILTCDI
ncbi:unnamed protein product [Didymodactylos carnosus]|uniref:Carbon-nitrogen hydrolase n=1 Tax=Didymodactylos carnosus TaxID=1234261 RepID=A0A813PXQ3_9BILA|nr:unnamed protein product [Didymodactylos carnosus]CAF3535516.1 unnamed protein product [Didymodactylos carnosus]